MRGGGEPADPTLETKERTVEQVAANSAYLNDFYDPGRMFLHIDIEASTRAPRFMPSYIGNWCTSPDLRIFWVDGSSFVAVDDDNTFTILDKGVANVLSCRFPTISYFCELRENDTIRKWDTLATQGLVAVVSGFIRQVSDVKWLMPYFGTAIDLSEDRFKKFDGTIHT